MNYDKIKKDYPKAWEAFSKWINQGEWNDPEIQRYADAITIPLNNETLSPIRKLFDFFDSHGVYVTVNRYWYQETDDYAWEGEVNDINYSDRKNGNHL